MKRTILIYDNNGGNLMLTPTELKQFELFKCINVTPTDNKKRVSVKTLNAMVRYFETK